MDQTSTPSDRPDDDDLPLGGDETTQDQLQADNAVEEDQLRALDPEAPSA
ncbi:hypothetical protein ABC304_11325 [Microbacterium sp. 1P10UB]